MKQKTQKFAVHTLFFLYIFVLLRLTVLRSGAFSHRLFSGRFNLTPGVAYMQLLSWGSYFHAFYLFFGNIVWFMPLGMYLRWLRLRFFACLLWGAACSLLIETFQFILGSGITETDDLLLNTCGAIIGALFFNLLQHIKRS